MSAYEICMLTCHSGCNSFLDNPALYLICMVGCLQVCSRYA